MHPLRKTVDGKAVIDLELDEDVADFVEKQARVQCVTPEEYLANVLTDMVNGRKVSAAQTVGHES